MSLLPTIVKEPWLEKNYLVFIHIAELLYQIVLQLFYLNAYHTQTKI